MDAIAITWGAWSSNGRLRAGIEYFMSPSSVGSGTSSVDILCRLWMQTRYASDESGGGSTPWTMTGSIARSGSGGGWSLAAMGTKLLTAQNSTFSTSFSFASTVTVTGKFTSSFAYPGTAPTVTASIVIPKRPYAVPAAPSGVTGTRNSDTQATVAWTRNVTTVAPYVSHTLQMRTFTGSAWGAWSTIASPTGTATTYVRSGLSANRLYQFQIRSNNTAGSSDFVLSGSVWMTPAAPSSVSSTLLPTGTSIRTAWVANNYTGVVPAPTFTIQRSINGGAYATVASGVAASPWTDPSPGIGTNQYRVAASTSVGGLLTSAYATGNMVATVVAPLAPTLLAPNGVAADLTDDLTLSWRHNHAGDNADQSHYTVQYSTDGGSSWLALSGDQASTTSTHLLPGGTLANGATYLWRARTQGTTLTAYGPYSAAATLTGSAIPTVTLDPDHPPESLVTAPLDAWWAYNQDQGSPQTGWEALLYADDGLTVLESLSGSSDVEEASFTYPVADGASYFTAVRARSGAGLWSEWAIAATTVDLLPPAPAVVVPEFQPCTGTVLLSIDAADPGAGEVAVQYVVVERRVQGGQWVTLAAVLEVPAEITDPLPSTNGLNEYRVTSVSASPSYRVNPIVEVMGTDGEPGSPLLVHLTWGPDWGTRLRLQGDPDIQEVSSRVRAAVEFRGRRKPWLLVGENRGLEVSVGGSLHYDEHCPVPDPEDCRLDSAPPFWRQASHEAEAVAYRDYTGRRVFGMLSDMQVSEGIWKGHAAVSFSVTETDFTERGG